MARSSKRDEIAGDDWWPILGVADNTVRGSGFERLRRHVQPKYLRDDRLGVKEIAGWYRILPDGLLQALAVTWGVRDRDAELNVRIVVKEQIEGVEPVKTITMTGVEEQIVIGTRLTFEAWWGGYPTTDLAAQILTERALPWAETASTRAGVVEQWLAEPYGRLRLGILHERIEQALAWGLRAGARALLARADETIALSHSADLRQPFIDTAARERLVFEES